MIKEGSPLVAPQIFHFKLGGIECLSPVHVRKLTFFDFLLITLKDLILQRLNKRKLTEYIPKTKNETQKQ